MDLHLDNAATSFPKPEQVYLAVENTMRRVGVSPGRGGYGRGVEASRLVFEAREAVADFFRIADSSRVVFTHSATEALNLAVRGLLKPGDHVVTSTMEHNSLARPLHEMSRRSVDISWVEADGEGFIDPERVRAEIRPDTRLVALTHCSNVTGTVQAIEEIGRITRAAGVPLLVDAAQSAGHLPIDVQRMKIDLLAAPGHKGLLGPQGTGFLYIDEGITLEPVVTGGTGSSSQSLDQPESMPERYESGTLNLPGIAGLKAGIEYIRQIGLQDISRHEKSLLQRIVAGLEQIDGVAVHGPRDPERRCGVVSFTVAGIDPSRIGFQLDRDHGISVRVGLHCAPLAHKTIGTFPAGTVRVSPGYFTTEADIDLFLAALRTVIA